MTPEERNFWVRKMGDRRDWWELRKEAIIAPELEIVDAHIHLWDSREIPDPQGEGRVIETNRYLLEEFLRDTQSGHNVTGCVYIECGSRYLSEGPAHLRPLGETGFAVSMAKELAAMESAPQIKAIVAYADLRHPDLETVLDAHQHKSDGLVRGIRHSAARLDDPSARLIAGAAPAGLSADPDFRRGVALLGTRGLCFDSFQFHFQLEEAYDLALATPGTTIIINHLGGPLGFTRNSDGEDSVFTAWAEGIDRLAALPNVMMKLGGMASIVTGYDGYTRDCPPSSEEFVAERGAYFHHAISRFGAERCMFESNFPVDSLSISYAGLWNAFKIISMQYSSSDQQALLAGTARRVYGF